MEHKGLGTKILPEAFDWHYAGAWEHIFKEIEYYNEVDIHTKWASTENILRRSICINIPINITKDRCNQIINIIKEGCNKYE